MYRSITFLHSIATFRHILIPSYLRRERERRIH
uniref:Uncharacterized protein n=1 Tax=Rhizophora mucronata TaxID=61149 RepID=A0A2P2QPS8_RHIMU